MALAAGYIVMQRRQNIHALQQACQDFYAYLTEETEHLTLEYRSGATPWQNEIEIRDFYLRQFHKNRERELVLGYTLTGPHKDDLNVEIGGRDARIFASEGQQRSCVTALHVGEWQHLKKTAGDTPLFMVDDVGISLDDQRRERLISYLTTMGQVFLTTTDAHLLDSYAGEKRSIALPLEKHAADLFS